MVLSVHHADCTEYIIGFQWKDIVFKAILVFIIYLENKNLLIPCSLTDIYIQGIHLAQNTPSEQVLQEHRQEY